MGKRQSQEVKEHIAKLHIEEGRKATDLAYEVGVNAATVRQWVADYREKQQRLANPDSELVTFTEMEKKLREAEHQLKERDEELEILKKAMHVFMKSRT
jgi:transposase